MLNKNLGGVDVNMKKIHTHWKIDIAYVALFFIIGGLYVGFWSWFFEETPLQTVSGLFTFDCGDFITCLLQFLFYLSLIIATIVALNFGFRVFEYNDDGFCMRSMFSHRCYRWKDVDEIYESTKFGADWVMFSTSDGNFYYCPFNSRVLDILEAKTKKKVTTVYDPYEVSPSLRKRRRRHRQRMMFLQP